MAIGHFASALRDDAVAIGARSVANVANTVSVGRPGAARRIMNVAAAVNTTDAVNLAQVQALIAGATGAAPATVATAVAPPPAVSVGLDDAKNTTADIRRELSELRALVKLQQQRIARLEGARAAAR